MWSARDLHLFICRNVIWMDKVVAIYLLHHLNLLIINILFVELLLSLYLNAPKFSYLLPKLKKISKTDPQPPHLSTNFLSFYFRSNFIRYSHRLMDLSMSQVLSSDVTKVMSSILFEISDYSWKGPRSSRTNQPASQPPSNMDHAVHLSQLLSLGPYNYRDPWRPFDVTWRLWTLWSFFLPYEILHQWRHQHRRRETINQVTGPQPGYWSTTKYPFVTKLISSFHQLFSITSVRVLAHIWASLFVTF